MVANILPTESPYPTLVVGSKGQNSSFPEYGRVEYQIQGNDECSSMVANILPADSSPRPQGWDLKIKIQLFSEHGHVHIKLIKSQMQRHGPKYFAAYPPSHPGGGGGGVRSKGQNSFLFRTWSCCISKLMD